MCLKCESLTRPNVTKWICSISYLQKFNVHIDQYRWHNYSLVGSSALHRCSIQHSQQDSSRILFLVQLCSMWYLKGNNVWLNQDRRQVQTLWRLKDR